MSCAVSPRLRKKKAPSLTIGDILAQVSRHQLQLLQYNTHIIYWR